MDELSIVEEIFEWVTQTEYSKLPLIYKPMSREQEMNQDSI